MKKILLTILLSLSIPSLALAAVAVGWNATSTNAGYISPNMPDGINIPFIRVPYIVATSTTKASVLPYASTTALSVSGNSYLYGNVGVATSSALEALSIYGNLNIQNTAATSINTSFNIGTIVDPFNSAVNALAIYPRDDTYYRLELGTPAHKIYQVDFTNVVAGIIGLGNISTNYLEGATGGQQIYFDSPTYAGGGGGRDAVYVTDPFDFFPSVNDSKPALLRNTRVVDSSSAVGFVLKTLNTLSTTGSVLLNVDNGASTKFTILGNGDVGMTGNVGIGTAAPSNKLDVEGATLINTGTGATTFNDLNIGGVNGWSGNEAHRINTVYSGTASTSNIVSTIETAFDGVMGNMYFRNFYNSGNQSSILMTIKGNGNVGIGTTTPAGTLSVQGGSSTVDSLVVATSSGNTIAGFDGDGHAFTSGPAGAVSSCGTGSPSVSGDDQSGTITTATAATTCTYTFAKAFKKTPNCRVTDDSLVGFADVASISTSAVTFGISSALTGGHLYYDCTYHR